MKKLYWNGKANEPVELVKKVNGGWIIRTQAGTLIGPVKESPAILR